MLLNMVKKNKKDLKIQNKKDRIKNSNKMSGDKSSTSSFGSDMKRA